MPLYPRHKKEYNKSYYIEKKLASCTPGDTQLKSNVLDGWTLWHPFLRRKHKA